MQDQCVVMNRKLTQGQCALTVYPSVALPTTPKTKAWEATVQNRFGGVNPNAGLKSRALEPNQKGN